ncbi:fla cluster protein FlaF [Halovenus rubra]|uniref:Fla cluster protein FlaF n=2 Tax=Halovenus rubra TaxID=869890 RepID=A0ACC7E1X8_9EURY|nr:fla cluster protein FlaF [Halovenus rubra]
MGFSVSGSAAIIFLSLFIAFGMLYTTADNSFNSVFDAQDDQTDGALEMKNTNITVGSTDYSDPSDELTITANNTGATALSLNATSLLVDNSLAQGWEANASVDSNEKTDLWLPGETVTITVSKTSQPARVSLTTASGVSATAEVAT